MEQQATKLKSRHAGGIEFISPKALRYRRGAESIRFEIKHKEYPGLEGAVLVFCPKKLLIEETGRELTAKEFKGIRAEISSAIAEYGSVAFFLSEVTAAQYPRCAFD